MHCRRSVSPRSSEGRPRRVNVASVKGLGLSSPLEGVVAARVQSV